jgi:hypothetical protein
MARVVHLSNGFAMIQFEQSMEREAVRELGYESAVGRELPPKEVAEMVHWININAERMRREYYEKHLAHKDGYEHLARRR